MFGTDRTELRRFFLETWRKMQASSPLTPLEDMLAQVITAHPEYQPVLNSEEALDRDWLPEAGETNPFLHMALHVAVREHLSTNRPAGIVAAFDALCRRLGDTHAAEHAMLECLAEVLWQAQREGRLPDESAYLACVRARAA